MTDDPSLHAEDSAPTAADAAVLQHAEGFSLKQTAAHGPSASAVGEEASGAIDAPHGDVVRHPATALYDEVFDTIFPVVAALAERKNVPLEDGEQAPVLRHALGSVRRATMRRLMRGDPEAIRIIQMAINHSLDVLACMRLICACRKPDDVAALMAQGKLLPMAEDALNRRAANHRGLVQIWPDLVTTVTKEFNKMLARESQIAPVALPKNISIRCSVHMPLPGSNAT